MCLYVCACTMYVFVCACRGLCECFLPWEYSVVSALHLDINFVWIVSNFVLKKNLIKIFFRHSIHFYGRVKMTLEGRISKNIYIYIYIYIYILQPQILETTKKNFCVCSKFKWNKSHKVLYRSDEKQKTNHGSKWPTGRMKVKSKSSRV